MIFGMIYSPYCSTPCIYFVAAEVCGSNVHNVGNCWTHYLALRAGACEKLLPLELELSVSLTARSGHEANKYELGGPYWDYALNEINLWFLIRRSHLKSSPDHELRRVILKCKIDRAQVVPNLHILHESVGSFLNDPTNCQNLWRIFVEHEPLDPSHQDHLCHIYDFGVEESCYWIVMKCQNITITSHCIRHPQIIQDSHDFPDFESFNQWKKIQVLRYNPQKVARLAGAGCHRNWVCH